MGVTKKKIREMKCKGKGRGRVKRRRRIRKEREEGEDACAGFAATRKGKRDVRFSVCLIEEKQGSKLLGY